MHLLRVGRGMSSTQVGTLRCGLLVSMVQLRLWFINPREQVLIVAACQYRHR